MEHVSSVRPTGKFPEKVENLKRWARFPGWNFRTECRVPFTFLVVCTSSRSTVGHRDVPVFTTKWNNFLPLLLPPKFPFFFPKWKAPDIYHFKSSVGIVIDDNISLDSVSFSVPEKRVEKFVYFFNCIRIYTRR